MTSPGSGAFFGRRKGKALRERQAGLMGALLPRVSVQLDALAQAPKAVCPHADRLWLEIGFGGGEHLAADAARHPGVCFIGCEPFVNGVAKLVSRIEGEKLDNIRIHHGDAIEVLDALPDASVGRVSILYPDPWPKQRQKKRRFISTANLDRLARVLQPGGELRFATDIDDYSGWTLARVLARHDFEWRASCADDWRKPWPDWPGTRYEAKAVREGRSPAYLTFFRTSGIRDAQD
jgi:tRNA (guanine-N7-)-methyltransferase